MYATLTIEAIDFEQELIFTPEERYAQLTLYVQQLQLSVESNLSTVVAEFFLGNYLKGVGISSIVKTSSVGLVDTYTITFTDNTTTTFEVTNGKDGADGIGISNIELVSTIDKVKTYRITFTDSSTFEYTITDGADGRGIVSFDLINTVGKTKTYRLLYTDATYVDINIIDGNDGNDGTGAYQIYVLGGGTLSEVYFNESITDIPSHIGDETIHHTIEELNLLYSDINHNHNLNDLTEKSYNSLTDKPDLSSLHIHANKEDLDNYDPDNFEPANDNIQSHISNTDIHIDSSSELGEDINESTHSLLLWNGLKALKVTFARLKTWIGSYFFAIGGNTFGAKKLIGSTDNQDFGIITNNTERVTVLKDGKVGIRTTAPLKSLDVSGNFRVKDSSYSSAILSSLTSSPDFGTALYLSNAVGDGSNQTGIRIRATYGGVGTLTKPNFAIDRATNTQSYNGDISTLTYINSLTIDGNNGNVGIDRTTPKSKLQVNGGIQFGDDTAAASADKKGTTRYREWEAGGFGYSAEERCMKTGINQYTWVAIVTNSWSL